MKGWFSRTGIAATAALVVAMALAQPARAADDPKQVVKSLTDAVVAVLQDKSTTADAKRSKIEGIVKDHTDFDTMSRLILARNWKDLPDPKKAQFVDEFREHLSVTYGKNVESYHDEKVQIAGDRDEGRGDWTVMTKILRPAGGGDILVDYRLRQQNGEWKVIDIVIERVSLVSNFRSQFQDLMANGGIDKVLAVLKEKNASGQPMKAPGA